MAIFGKRIRLALALACAAAAAGAWAQFFDRLVNPNIEVDIDHPPDLGLHVDRLVFGPAEGACSDEIIQALIADFVSNGIEVIDRDNLDLILAEHDFNFSGYVDKTTAASIGKILGPSAMLVVRVQRCATEQYREKGTTERYDDKTEKLYTVPLYRAQTVARVKASAQAIDLTTGRIFSARSLEHSPDIVVESEEGYPAYPSDFDVLDIAYRSVVWDVHRMFLPWTETTSLVFYNDKKCNLKSAHQALRSGLTDRAAELSEQNLASCKATPKVRKSTLAHAYYNVGMTRMIQGDYDGALDALYDAAELRPGQIVTEAIEDTSRAKELAASIRRIDAQAALDLQRRDAAEPDPRRSADADTLTNADVIEMATKGLPATIIMRKIGNSKTAFDTSPDALVALTEAGVDEDIIMAMIDAG